MSFAAHDPTFWAITVTDTGPGLAEEISSQLFAGISAGDDSSRRRAMGLAIIRDLVRFMGGALRVTTRSEVGTSFMLILPIAGPVTES